MGGLAPPPHTGGPAEAGRKSTLVKDVISRVNEPVRMIIYARTWSDIDQIYWK